MVPRKNPDPLETGETAGSNGSEPAILANAVPDIPDFLGVGGRVKIVSDMIVNAQTQLLNFQSLMLVNSESLDDKIAVADGSPDRPTYRERLAQLREGLTILMAENEDIHDELIAAAVKRRKELDRE